MAADGRRQRGPEPTPVSAAMAGVLAVEPVDDLVFGPAVQRSGNVPIWSGGAITCRLESSLPMADAMRVAESLVPVGE